MNANYDNLAASYVADQAGLITIVGPVFANPGSYRVDVEVSGIDFDNTFLPEPIKYNYALAIAEAKSFDISLEGSAYNVSVLSPSPVDSVRLVPDKKQLVIQYPSQEWQHFDNFQVAVDVPSELMSGPFTATFNGMELQVSEEQNEGRTVLSLNGTHLDLMQMDNSSGMEGHDMGSQQNAIVITATNVVPEFPLALVVGAAAIASSIVFTRKAKGRLSF